MSTWEVEVEPLGLCTGAAYSQKPAARALPHFSMLSVQSSFQSSADTARTLVMCVPIER